MLGRSILNKSSSPTDAISLLIVELERQFVHMHPAIQRILLEFSNIDDSSVKRVTTIFLAYEFGHIMKEAREIFLHYNINCGCPPIEEIILINRKLQNYNLRIMLLTIKIVGKRFPHPFCLTKFPNKMIFCYKK